MGEKSEKRDIMDEILSGNQDDAVEGLDLLYDVIRVKSSSPLKSDDKPQGLPASKTSRKKTKKKASHYLTHDVFDELGEIKSSMRDLLPSVPKSKLTKSNIVDIAVKALLEEYKEKGTKSELMKKIVSGDKKTKIPS